MQKPVVEAYAAGRARMAEISKDTKKMVTRKGNTPLVTAASYVTPILLRLRNQSAPARAD